MDLLRGENFYLTYRMSKLKKLLQLTIVSSQTKAVGSNPHIEFIACNEVVVYSP